MITQPPAQVKFIGRKNHPMTHVSEFEYAGFLVRVAAFAADHFLFVIVTTPILLIIYGWGYFDIVLCSDNIFAGPIDFIFTVVLLFVAVILFWMYWQATPGKMAIQAKIVDEYSGRKPSNWQCVGRYLAYIPAILCLGIGIMWIALDPRKQGWHDKLAGTVVIRSKSKVHLFEN